MFQNFEFGRINRSGRQLRQLKTSDFSKSPETSGLFCGIIKIQTHGNYQPSLSKNNQWLLAGVLRLAHRKIKQHGTLHDSYDCGNFDFRAGNLCLVSKSGVLIVILTRVRM